MGSSLRGITSMLTKTIAALIFVCLITVAAGAQAAYTVTDLGSLAPTAINSWAQVVGNYNNQAYVWSFGQTRALGKLPGGISSSAAAISDLGVVAGTADGKGTVVSFRGSPSQTEKCSDLTQPFVWTPASGMRGLGTVGDPNYSFAWCELPFDASGVNDLGQVVGFLAGSYNETQWGFFWTKAKGINLLGGSWTPTFARGINNLGQIVGQNSYGNNAFAGHATSWKKSVATDLGTLGGGPEILDYASSANGVNEVGQIVGWSTIEPVSFAGSMVHAVLWSASTGIVDLGTLPGDTSSEAKKINLFGQVIGSSGSTLYPFPYDQNLPFQVTGRPFLWSSRTGMQDLNELLPPHSGWVLNTVTDINVWGQIVGSGTKNGKPRGYLLIPTSLYAGPE